MRRYSRSSVHMTTETDVEAPSPPESVLGTLHNTGRSVEKLRVAMGNRVSALARGADEATPATPEIYKRLMQMASDMELMVDAAVAEELHRWPVYESWLRHVKGVGPSLSGQLLALLLPVRKDKGPSSWYKAAGLVPSPRPDGMMRLPRPRAGEGKITYHPWLRRCLHNVSTSFVMHGGYYRDQYDQRKRRLAEVHAGDKDWPSHRLDSVARWSTVKLFLAHLWEACCEEEGITPRAPYALDVLGHSTYIPRPMPSGGGKL